jgi:putative transposase
MKRDTGPNALRRGRASLSGANYFVTACAVPREPVLRATVADAILAALLEPETGSIWRLRCGTIMPDHIHCLIELGNVHSLSRALGRFKALTKTTLIAATASWQENFYDHRLRPNESAEPVIRYIFMNPYAAGLIQPGENWPWFCCCAEDWTWFSGLTDSGRSYPEWLM